MILCDKLLLKIGKGNRRNHKEFLLLIELHLYFTWDCHLKLNYLDLKLPLSRNCHPRFNVALFGFLSINVNVLCITKNFNIILHPPEIPSHLNPTKTLRCEYIGYDDTSYKFDLNWPYIFEYSWAGIWFSIQCNRMIQPSLGSAIKMVTIQPKHSAIINSLSRVY